MSKLKKFQKHFHKWAWSILAIFIFSGFFYPAIGILAVICMVAPPVGALFNGRTTCSWFCPRGSFFDSIISKVSRNKRIPALFYTLRFRLAFLILIMAIFVIRLIQEWGSLADVGRVFVIMITATTLIGIILGTVFKPRAWCSFCPMGVMGSWVSKLKKNTYICLEKEKCNSCGTCSRICPMQLTPNKHKDEHEIYLHDCLRCKKCQEACPKYALKLLNKSNARKV